MYNWDTPKNLLDFGNFDLIFTVTAVEKLKIHSGGGVGHLFSLKTLLLVESYIGRKLMPGD